MIIVIIGQRQAGKTFRTFQLIKELLKDIPKDNILYLNFEHERVRRLDANNLEDYDVKLEVDNAKIKCIPLWKWLLTSS
ncbi:MAG: AAA family ATPase [Nitrososphaeria archaeon]